MAQDRRIPAWPSGFSGREGDTPPPATLKFPDGELDTWVCLGHITNQSVRVWVRAPSLTTAVASLKINAQPVAEAPLQPSADHDFVDAVDIPFPRASSGCPFAVHVAGHCRQGFLPPPPHEPAAFSFAFGSLRIPGSSSLDRVLPPVIPRLLQ